MKKGLLIGTLAHWFILLLIGSLAHWLISVPADAWIDGTPYFYEHFPNLTHLPPPPTAPAVPNAAQLVVGEQQSFFSIDLRTHAQYTVRATLRAVGQFCYIFVEDPQWGRTANARTVENVRRAFDDAVASDPRRGIYEIETNLFGAPPNVDGDARIYILLLDIRDSAARGGGFVAGFFNPIDQERGVLRHPELGTLIRSNERDMLYIDTHPLDAGGRDGLGVLAHEFQHLIHWGHDRDEDVWINEGCSDYAMFICGYFPKSHVTSFEEKPDISLVNWPNGTRSQLAHYGAAYLWMLYLHEHYGGPQTIASIIQHRGNGTFGINSALQSRGITKDFTTIYADWKVANFLDDTRFADGQYGYQSQELNLRPQRTHRSYPLSVSGDTIDTYAANYINFSPSGGKSNLNIAFEGNGNLPYDIKAIELEGNRPISIRNVSLTAQGQGHLTVPNFGVGVEELILVPSTYIKDNAISGGGTSSYSYRVSLGDQVTFKTWVLPNPIHQRYWDVIAMPSGPIGLDALLIAITLGNTSVATESMKPIENGTIYTHSIYLSPEVEPENVEWRILFFNEVVGEGKVNVRVQE